MFGGRLILPHYYRSVVETPNFDSYSKNIVRPLLKKNLKLDYSDAFAGSTGAYKDFFLCLETDDADLPWDVEQEDW